MTQSHSSKGPRPRRLATNVGPNRYLVTAVTLILTGSAAVAVAYALGDGLRPMPPQSLDAVGKLEVIRLPITARKLSEVKSFVVRMDGADDYARVYVNNYLVLNREAPYLFYRGKDSADKRDAVSARTAQRNVNKLGSLEAKQYLRLGRNYVIVEAENAIGPCAAGVDIIVNGTQLEFFPKVFPDSFSVDKESVNYTLFRKIADAQSNSKVAPEFAPDPLDDVVCARRIFEVHLK